MRRIVMIGDGGHGKVVRELIALTPDARLEAVLDDRYAAQAGEAPHIGPDGELRGPVAAWRGLLEQDAELAFVAAIGDNRVRHAIVRMLEAGGARFARLIHPSAIISPRARIGPGAVVMARAVVQPDAVVGAHAIVNTGAIVEHDCVLGDCAHAAPGAVLAGGVRAGEGALIGAGAVILPGRTVGDWSTAGAGAVVTRDMPPGCTAAGVPAAVIKRTGTALSP
jgi:acetyltransferase EpsM